MKITKTKASHRRSDLRTHLDAISSLASAGESARYTGTRTEIVSRQTNQKRSEAFDGNDVAH